MKKGSATVAISSLLLGALATTASAQWAPNMTQLDTYSRVVSMSVAAFPAETPADRSTV